MAITFWNRYVDDCLVIGEGNEDDIQALLTFINTINPHIQFTYECSHHQINFLDLTVHIDPKTTTTIQTELFIKPSSLGIFLNYNSAHPKSTIVNSAQSEIACAIKNGSNEYYKKQGVNKIIEVLKRNAYPETIIDKIHKKAIEKTTNQNNNQLEPKDKLHLCLPYVNEQHKRKVYTILRKNNLLTSTKVTFKPDKKLKNILTRSVLQPTKCNSKSTRTCCVCDSQCMIKNIVYKLTCTICHNIYVGRLKRYRCWEHYKSVRDKTSATAMGQHYMEHHTNHDMPTNTLGTPFKFEVMRACTDYTDRQLWQSYFIKSLSPKINTQLSNETDSWKKHTWTLI